MRSCLSLVVMLIVIAAILAGGYWLYQQQSSKETTLTLNNRTSYGLTVDMRGPLVVQFAIMPGKSQTRKIAPGDYAVKGSLSDPKTDRFESQWSFERGVEYNADFTRSGDAAGARLVVLQAARAPAPRTTSQSAP